MITVEQAVAAAQRFLDSIGHTEQAQPYGLETPDVYLLAREPQLIDDTMLVVDKATGAVRLEVYPLTGPVPWPDAVHFGTDPRSIASRWDPQPASLAYAPPAYPSHQFKGTGTLWRLHVAGTPIGFLSTQGNPPTAVVWQPAPDLDDVGWEYAGEVSRLLREGARDDVALADTVAAIYAAVQADPPEDVDLATLRP